jgi:hypothetical protein
MPPMNYNSIVMKISHKSILHKWVKVELGDGRWGFIPGRKILEDVIFVIINN